VMATVEQLVRILGAVAAGTAWTAAGWRAAREARRPAGRGTGLAPQVGAALTYLVGAVPYATVCVLLWRPLPRIASPVLRALALGLGAVLGFSGLALYLCAIRTLDGMYNVSSSFGSQLYAEHRLVTDGPYAHVRHPMYVAQVLAVLGALLVYRTWATVFMLVMLPAPAVKARNEERLLEAELGASCRAYRERVPGWVPRRRSMAPSEHDRESTPSVRGSTLSAHGSTVTGRRSAVGPQPSKRAERRR
jgi:protein-S-isoprenylcysteine O-methyltransferase Ste14